MCTKIVASSTSSHFYLSFKTRFQHKTSISTSTTNTNTAITMHFSFREIQLKLLQSAASKGLFFLSLQQILLIWYWTDHKYNGMHGTKTWMQHYLKSGIVCNWIQLKWCGQQPQSAHFIRNKLTLPSIYLYVCTISFRMNRQQHPSESAHWRFNISFKLQPFHFE